MLIKSQNGNALFLILIAVALFAALSYAITQSGRGGGTIDKETAALAASQITQQAAGVRTAIQRMILTGTAATDISFNGAATAEDSLSDAPCDTHPDYCVFSSSGGGATDDPLPTVPEGTWGGPGGYPGFVPGRWGYYGVDDGSGQGYYITGVGSDADHTGHDAIANLWDLPLALCQQLNKGLGLDTTPLDSAHTDLNIGAASQDYGIYNLGWNVFSAYPGQAFACFRDPDNGGLGYYHALIEQ